jgi:hypothetical protein
VRATLLSYWKRIRGVFAMDYFWVLIAMPLLGLVYFACVLIWTPREIRLPDCVTPLPPTNSGMMRIHQGRTPEREVRWVSTKECDTLLHRSSDVLFIDLRTEPRKAPIPIDVSEVLTLSPSQLFDMLRWLPASSSVVLYGASDACTSVLWSTRNIHGWAPIYVLHKDSNVGGERLKCPA